VIKLAKMKSQDEFVLNAELIETVEETPDTVITLTNGKKLLVEESMDEVIRKVMDYRRALYRGMR
jgi:flagellar protein FlbD